MAEQQLVDYIKKAKQVGQSDDQTRALLYKNGWTEAEVSEGFAAMNQTQVSQPQAQVQPQTQQFGQEIKPQAQVQPQAQPQTQPRVQIKREAQPEPQTMQQAKYQQPAQASMSQMRPNKPGKAGAILKILIVLIILLVLGTIGYIAVTQYGALTSLFTKVSTTENTGTGVTPPAENAEGNVENEPVVNNAEQPVQTTLETKSLSAIAGNYDVAKTTVAAFSEDGSKVAYCGVDKTTGKVDCYLNEIKLDNAYAYKPYWVGISPDGNRVVFLYYDSVKKQSFTYENGVEGTKQDGTISSPTFSKNSLNFMYIVITKDGKNYAVFNDVASAKHDKIYTIPELSSDGKYMVYGARDGLAMSWVADKVQP